jgi:hypothetical protein
VRKIFRLYDDLGCLNAVMRRANDLGLRSKLHRFKSGRVQGGNPFSRGQTYALLRNPIYIGKIRHKAQVWDGQHEAVVDEAVWDRVQAKLQAASARPRGQMGSAHQQSPNSLAPLMGKLRDETGDRLTPTHTRRHGRQIRYYVSNRLISGGTDPRGWRLPAPALEQAVADITAQHIGNLARGHRICLQPDLQRGDAIQARARSLASRFSEGSSDLLEKLVVEGRIEKHRIVLLLQAAALAEALDIQPDEIDPSALRIAAPFALRRRGVEGRIVVGNREPEPDRTLLRALSRAHAWVADLHTGKLLSEIAAATRHSGSYIRTRAQLAFLSPAIQRAILEGRQPPDLTLEQMIRKPVPLDWDKQEKLYGFAGG